MPDVDVHQDEVAFEQGQVAGVVEVDVEHLAVAAPVAAKVEQDALVGLRGGVEGGGQVGLGLRWIGIDVAARGCARTAPKAREGECDELEGLQH